MKAMDRTTGVPALRQVAAEMRNKITNGEYAPDARLPSERDLVESYGVSRPTIRDAINLLRSEGIVVAEHGRGVFVRPPASIHRLARTRLSREARQSDRGAFLGDAHTHGSTPSSSVEVHFTQADERVAECLGLTSGDKVTVRDRVMRADGHIVQIAVSRLPRTLTRETAIEQVDAGKGGVYARLEESGHQIVRFAEHVGARMPTPDELSMLQLSTGVPVVTITRIAYGERERPLEMNDIVLAADRFELTYEWDAE